MARRALWAVVPLKEPRQAKQRLSPLLSADEREALARAMAEDVIAALAAARGLAGILVVARASTAHGFARPVGARVIAELGNRGMRSAIAAAARRLASERAAGMLVVPADVPLITPGEIETVLSVHGAAPSVTLVPAASDLGTNGLACSPADIIPPLFGPQSFLRHREAATAQGLEPRVVPMPGWGRDIDRPEDLLAFVAAPSRTRSYGCLEKSGIAARLRTAPQPLRSAGRAG